MEKSILLKKWRNFNKRLFDVVFSLTFLLLLFPIIIIIAISIRLESPGPIIYARDRVGYKETPFRQFIFRTMKVNSEKAATGPVFDLKLDTRISRVGRFLRRSALDELPALLNVLKGEMSLVGPRAALPLEAWHYSESQKLRLEVKPGFTGYWQVFGRRMGEQDLAKMTEMDIEYIEKQSLLLDLRIVIRTIMIAMKNKAAY